MSTRCASSHEEEAELLGEEDPFEFPFMVWSRSSERAKASSSSAMGAVLAFIEGSREHV